MNEKIKVLIDKIKNAKSIAISGHKNPDGDALCSALALMKIIELNFGKKATVIYDGNIPKYLEEVPLRKKANFHQHIPEDSKFDLYILVDYGRLLVTGEQISPEYDSGASEGDDSAGPNVDEGEVELPANEPSFFERIWNFFTGQ